MMLARCWHEAGTTLDNPGKMLKRCWNDAALAPDSKMNHRVRSVFAAAIGVPCVPVLVKGMTLLSVGGAATCWHSSNESLCVNTAVLNTQWPGWL